MNLQAQSSFDNLNVQNCIAILEKSADEVWQQGYFGLQDVCLLLLDVLRELSEDDQDATNTFVPIIAEWPKLVEAYKKSPTEMTPEILGVLLQPELKIPLSEEEFEMIAAQLSEGKGSEDALANELNVNGDKTGDQVIVSILDNQKLEDHALIIELLADQAAIDGHFGLQDACLLLAEALCQLQEESDESIAASLSASLAVWPTLVQAYSQNRITVTTEILNFLHRPELKIALSDDEFQMLEYALVDDYDESADEASDDLSHVFDALSDAVNQSDEKHKAPELNRILPRETQEILDMLLMQAELVDNLLREITPTDSATAFESLQEAEVGLQRLGHAAETAGYKGLALICEHTNANIHLLMADVVNLSSRRLDLLGEFIKQTKEYLFNFSSIDEGRQLVFLLSNEDWILPLSLQDASDILMQIRPESLNNNGDQEVIVRKQVAEPDDVALTLPDDVNQELLEILLHELPIQTQQFSTAIQRLQSSGSAEDVQIAQRIAHTLKGSANTVGIKGIATLTHNLEDILTACSREERQPKGQLAFALMNASDCLEGMSEALLGLGEPPADAVNVLQEILDWANRIDREDVSVYEDLAEADQELSSAEIVETDEKVSGSTAQASMVRVPVEQLESLFRLSGESIILNSQAFESMRRMKVQLGLMQTQFSLLQQLGNELERLIDLKDLSGTALSPSGSGFDLLEMDQYNELHTVSRRMAESAVDAREISLDAAKELDNLDQVLDFQQRMVIDSQEIVMQTRLVPISTIVPRLQRSLRQTCRLTGKQCELKLSGESILIDGDTLNALVDPLMHILRNAVDHGIETDEERRKIGKPDNGLIVLDFDREGNNIFLRCRDDGRGLDFAAIRSAAEQKGFLQADQTISEEDLKRFILRPNFSTRSVATQTSGRGVGMDVVRAEILDMGGTLTLDSLEGQGLSIEIRVPLPLSMTYALITNVGPYRVAIANKGISQIVYAEDGRFVTEDGATVFQLESNDYSNEDVEPLVVSYPVVKLPDLLLVPDKRAHSHTQGSILLVQNEDKVTAVLIDRIIDSLNVVIKGMGEYIGKMPGFIGATILGDGTVIPVLDMPELLRAPVSVMDDDYYIFSQEAEKPDFNLPIALVVDDSLSQRRALEQLLVDAGFRVRTARDGIEAAEMLAKFKPDIILTDLEMPRMNGIELAAHIRNQENIKSVPIIMITSRTTQRHKKMAEDAGIDSYLTKPVRDVELIVKISDLLRQATDIESEENESPNINLNIG